MEKEILVETSLSLQTINTMINRGLVWSQQTLNVQSCDKRCRKEELENTNIHTTKIYKFKSSTDNIVDSYRN